MNARTVLLLAATALTLSTASSAFASGNTCDVASGDTWKTADEAKSAAEAAGFKVARVKKDNGCYEAYARDAQGGKVEVYVHPVSLQIVKVSKED